MKIYELEIMKFAAGSSTLEREQDRRFFGSIESARNTLRQEGFRLSQEKGSCTNETWIRPVQLPPEDTPDILIDMLTKPAAWGYIEEEELND